MSQSIKEEGEPISPMAESEEGKKARREKLIVFVSDIELFPVLVIEENTKSLLYIAHRETEAAIAKMNEQPSLEGQLDVNPQPLPTPPKPSQHR